MKYNLCIITFYCIPSSLEHKKNQYIELFCKYSEKIGLKETFNHKEADFIIFHWWLSRKKRKIINYSLMNNIKLIVVYHDNGIRTKNKKIKKMFEFMLEKCYKIIYLSHFTLKLLNKNYRKKALYLPHPLYEYNNESKKFIKFNNNWITFLLFGSEENWKNYPLVINSLKKMKCNLIVAGKTKKNYKGSSNFFLDNRYIPCDEVTAYFKSCDIVILPYDDTSVNTGVGTLSFQNCKTILSSSNVASLKDLKCKDFFTFSMVGKEILMGGEKKKTNEKNFMKAVDNIITKYDKFSLSKLGKNMRNEVKDNTTNFINGLKKLYS